jgi:mannose-6-phosphate isomerase-like protein (cupin superfamily)
MNWYKRVISLIFVFCLCAFGARGQTSQQSSKPDVESLLVDMADSFRQKAPSNLALIVQINIQPTDRVWHIAIDSGKSIQVRAGSHPKAQFIFSTTEETLRLVHEGKMTGLTAAGKAKDSDTAPLEMKFGEGVQSTSAVKETLFASIQRFFNRSIPEKILLGDEHSRVVHGGHAIPLYYYPGMRSAWYLLKKGQRLNEPGDTNPFPQAFIFISGEGFAKIGDTRLKVKAGESYYVPPNSDHVVWTESQEPLVLIFLAWGEGA